MYIFYKRCWISRAEYIHRRLRYIIAVEQYKKSIFILHKLILLILSGNLLGIHDQEWFM